MVNHSVLAKGIKPWKNEKDVMVECLELEIHDESEEARFIPVDYPFFEEVHVKVREIFLKGSEHVMRSLNKYGKQLAEKKWGELGSNWYTVREPHPKSQIENWPYKYQMIFVRAIHPCYQLKFTC